jgi:hypothetical protein
VGSSSLRGEDGRLDREQVERIAGEIITARAAGTRIVLVSSGAVSAGMGQLGFVRRPVDLPSLQAAAAVGQGQLIQAYQDVLATADLPVAQILLTQDDFGTVGGVRVTDTANGTTMLPGCCNWFEDWRDWYGLLDGTGQLVLGHDPWPLAELLGDTVRLTVDSAQDDSPTIELPAAELRSLLTDVEHDLTGFVRLASAWAEHHLPGRSDEVTAALGRVLDMPG